MKKMLSLIPLFALVFALAGCGGSETKTEATPPRDFPEGEYVEMGDGNAYISTPSGTSENGNIPVIYADNNITLYSIGLNAFDFNGSNLSFVYVDGMLSAKEQLADIQTSLQLTENQLTVGVHEIEIVQYSNDEPTGEMITYKAMKYEIKQK